MHHKKAVTQLILSRCGEVFVHVNADYAQVPAHLKHKKYLVFQFGYNLPVHIPDMRVTDSGISGTLSFKGIPHFVSIPWEACMALVDNQGKGQIYDQDLNNKELLAQVHSYDNHKNDIRQGVYGPKVACIEDAEARSSGVRAYSKPEQRKHLRVV